MNAYETRIKSLRSQLHREAKEAEMTEPVTDIRQACPAADCTEPRWVNPSTGRLAKHCKQHADWAVAHAIETLEAIRDRVQEAK